MPKLTRDGISRIDLANIQARKMVNIETDNAIRDYLERQGVIQIKSQLKQPTTYDEKVMKEFEMTHKIDENWNPIIFETNEPPPELINVENEFEDERSPEDIELIQQNLDLVVGEIDRTETRIREIRNRIENIREEMNIDDGRRRLEFTYAIRNLQLQLRREEEYLRERRNDYQQFNQMMIENNIIVERNQAKRRQNEKENEKIMKDYEYRSKLNRSRINTERRAGESEENY